MTTSIAVSRAFSRLDLKTIREAVRPTWEGDTRWPILQDKLSQLNSVPLLQMIREFCTEHLVPMSDSDYEIIRQTRKIRNDVVHGRRHLLPEREDIRRLRFVVTKILLRRLAMVDDETLLRAGATHPR